MLWRNLNDPINRSVVLLLNLIFFAYSASASDLTNGNFGAARAPVLPKSSRKSRTESKVTSEKKEPSTNTDNKSSESKRYPYHGTLDSVDPAGKFFVLKGKAKNRQIWVASKAGIWKDDQKASLTDGIPGERVSGSVHRLSDGREEASTVRFGEKSEPKKRSSVPTTRK
ncbi:MAG: hypothetical protein ACTHMT_00240 [Verrucomicrobiota bacterium]